MIVTIDGPAASGKSTTAKLVAEKLGISYLDTGGMYRCIAYYFMKNNLPFEDSDVTRSHLKKLDILIEEINLEQRFILNGVDISSKIRSNKVSKTVSLISSFSFVRELMVDLQRQYAVDKSIIVEGRDIGTIVFPDADFKFFLVADDYVRACRRQKDLLKNGENYSLKKLIQEIRLRDKYDSERENSPLTKASDAIVIDTSKKTINDQVDFIINKVKSNMKGKKNE